MPGVARAIRILTHDCVYVKICLMSEVFRGPLIKGSIVAAVALAALSAQEVVLADTASFDQNGGGEPTEAHDYYDRPEKDYCPDFRDVEAVPFELEGHQAQLDSIQSTVEEATDLEGLLTAAESIGELYSTKLEVVLGTPEEIARVEYGVVPIDRTADNLETRLSIGLAGLIEDLREMPPAVFALTDTQTISVGEENIFSLSNGQKYMRPGAYYSGQNEINISLGNLGTNVFEHEWAHALHERLCGGSFAFEEMFDGNNMPLGYFTQEEFMNGEIARQDPKYFEPGPERAYPTLYAAVNPTEYVAEMLQDLLNRRGIVQPGDPDEGSIYHQNQQQLVEILKELMPGIEVFLVEKTDRFRADPFFNQNVLKIPVDPSTLELSQMTLQNSPEMTAEEEAINQVLIGEIENDNQVTVDDGYWIFTRDGNDIAISRPIVTLDSYENEDGSTSTLIDTFSYFASGVNGDPELITFKNPGRHIRHFGSEDHFEMTVNYFENLDDSNSPWYLEEHADVVDAYGNVAAVGITSTVDTNLDLLGGHMFIKIP